MQQVAIAININSILDFRYDYKDKELDDIIYASRYYDKNEVEVSRLGFLNSKETHISKFLVFLITTLTSSLEIDNGITVNTTLHINLYPYVLEESEVQVLVKGLRVKFSKIVDVVIVENIKPDMGYFKKYRHVIDYHGFTNFNKSLDNDLNDRMTVSEMLSVIDETKGTTLYIPTIMDEDGFKKEKFDNVQDVMSFFDKVAKEIEPLIMIEYLPVDLFCKNTITLGKEG